MLFTSPDGRGDVNSGTQTSRSNSAVRPTDRRGCDSRGLPSSRAYPRRGIRCSAAILRFSRNIDAALPAAPGPMFLLQRRTRPGVREQGVVSGKIFQFEIGGVAVMAM